MITHEKIQKLYSDNQQLVHYLIMAIVLVAIEFLSYISLVWIGVNYLVAVPISMAIGIVLNWHGSRKFVFKTRRHAPHKEFILVLLTSLVGAGLQLVVTYFVVSVLMQWPATGKLVAITVTFFWNYWVRKKYIF